jgi:hypothetical protein
MHGELATMIGPDRRQIVMTMAEASKSFGVPGMNTKPFDPDAVVQ